MECQRTVFGPFEPPEDKRQLSEPKISNFSQFSEIELNTCQTWTFQTCSRVIVGCFHDAFERFAPTWHDVECLFVLFWSVWRLLDIFDLAKNLTFGAEKSIFSELTSGRPGFFS